MTRQMRAGLIALCVAAALGIVTFLIRANGAAVNAAAVTQSLAIVAALVGLVVVAASLLRSR